MKTITYLIWTGVIDSGTMVIGAKLENGKFVDGFGNDVDWVRQSSSESFFEDPEYWKVITEEVYNKAKSKYDGEKK